MSFGYSSETKNTKYYSSKVTFMLAFGLRFTSSPFHKYMFVFDRNRAGELYNEDYDAGKALTKSACKEVRDWMLMCILLLNEFPCTCSENNCEIFASVTLSYSIASAESQISDHVLYLEILYSGRHFGVRLYFVAFSRLFELFSKN